MKVGLIGSGDVAKTLGSGFFKHGHDVTMGTHTPVKLGDVRFVKAFNSVGNASMVNPQFKGGKPTMFICGNDGAAKKTVSAVLARFGWETADMGKAEAARAIEPLCMLWCIPGFLRNDWVHAFKLLTCA